MPIWVRGQEKMTLIEINAFDTYIHNDEINIIGFDSRNSNEDYFHYLGVYSSEEKALKVINMLKERIIEIDKSRFYGVENAYYTENFFQMPEDDEV